MINFCGETSAERTNFLSFTGKSVRISFTHIFKYLISSNKHPRRLLNFETFKCGAY